jgi:hypothetical protein
MTVQPGHVRLRSATPPLNTVVRLGPDLPQLSGGFGGWEVTGRPRAVGMTTWTGVPPFEYTINVLLGRQDKSTSVERVIRQIIAVARGTDDHPPGIVTIEGIPGLPAARWTINGLDFGDAIRRGNMERVRQALTLSFLEYQPPEYHLLGRGALAGARPKTVIYTVRKGDTPAKIARARHCKWTDIRAVNAKGLIKKANQHLKPGTRINVPIKHAPPKKQRRRRGSGGH